MPDLTITLTAQQVARVRAALGPGTTPTDVENFLKDALKNRVRTVEADSARNAKHDEVNTEIW